jgi:hypothetical protein
MLQNLADVIGGNLTDVVVQRVGEQHGGVTAVNNCAITDRLWGDCSSIILMQHLGPFTIGNFLYLGIDDLENIFTLTKNGRMPSIRPFYLLLYGE